MILYRIDIGRCHVSPILGAGAGAETGVSTPLKIFLKLNLGATTFFASY